MPKYAVTAQAFNRKTMRRVGKQRTEIINTKTNSLFKSTDSMTAIRRKYESFWNNLNPRSAEVVIVSKIVRRK